MVEDTISDPTRIAELLASELTGLSVGQLAEVSVVDADRSAEPSPDGTAAYTIAVEGTTVATVRLYPEAAVVEFADDFADSSLVDSPGDWPGVETDAEGLAVEEDAETVRLSVTKGAAVKRAVDAIRSLLSSDGL